MGELSELRRSSSEERRREGRTVTDALPEPSGGGELLKLRFTRIAPLRALLSELRRRFEMNSITFEAAKGRFQRFFRIFSTADPSDSELGSRKKERRFKVKV